MAMTLLAFATSIVVAVLTARGAGTVMKYGGNGLRADMLLGLAGSGSACLLAWMLDVFSEPGLLSTAVVAFAGAGGMIALQRRFFYVPLGKGRTPTWKP